MPMNPQKGNMFPFVNFTWNGIGGDCDHECNYCSTIGQKRNPVINDKYSGKPRLIDSEVETNFGNDNVIFVQNMSDLFADNVPQLVIAQVLEHCRDYPNNIFLYLTKNVKRYFEFIESGLFLPRHENTGTILGVTIETDQKIENTKAPQPEERWKEFCNLKAYPQFDRVFVIEPIMDFDIGILPGMILATNPTFVVIGANSNLKCRKCGYRFRSNAKPPILCPKCKHTRITNSDGIKEPTSWKITRLINYLLDHKIKVIKKQNLDRIWTPGEDKKFNQV